MAKRPALRAFGLGLVAPRHRARAAIVIDKMWLRLGRYVRAKLIEMAIIGAITYVALLVIGVRYALLLAVVVAAGEAVPQIGPWIERVPLLAVAALGGLTTLALAALASVVIENLKGFVIAPVVEADQVDIDPLLAIVSVLVGAAVFGPLGALVAVPAAACVQVVSRSWFCRGGGRGSRSPRPPSRGSARARSRPVGRRPGQPLTLTIFASVW